MSPMQLAKRLQTSIPNISQQLRILEAYGLVEKTRIPNAKRGKPRLVYSIKGAKAYLAVTGSASGQALIDIGPEEQFQLRIWSVFAGPARKALNVWASHISRFLSHVDYIGAKNEGYTASILLVVEDKHIGHVKKACVHAASFQTRDDSVIHFHFRVVARSHWKLEAEENLECLHRGVK